MSNSNARMSIDSIIRSLHDLREDFSAQLDKSETENKDKPPKSSNEQDMISIIPSEDELIQAIKKMEKLGLKGLNNKIALKLIEQPNGVPRNKLTYLGSNERIDVVVGKLKNLMLERISYGQ